MSNDAGEAVNGMYKGTTEDRGDQSLEWKDLGMLGSAAHGLVTMSGS